MEKARKELLTVITPVYNAAAFLKSSMESVLAEKLHFEYILVDDGSTDRSKDIIKSFSDSRIRYFYQKNAGPSLARNRALREARGQFILNVDADDLVLPGAIRLKLDKLQAQPGLDCAMGDMVRINQDQMARWTPWPFGSRPPSALQLLVYFARNGDAHDNQPMFRARALRALGGYLHTLGEDLDILIRLLLAGRRVGFINSITGIYRRHPRGLASGDLHRKRFFRDVPVGEAIWVLQNQDALIKKFLPPHRQLITNSSVFSDVEGSRFSFRRGGRISTVSIGATLARLLRLCNKRKTVRELERKLAFSFGSKKILHDMIFRLIRASVLDLLEKD